MNQPKQKGPALNFLIFIPKNIENSLVSNNYLKRIEDTIPDVKVFFDPNSTISELPGCVLNIKSEDMRKKKDASQMLFEYIVKNNLDETNFDNQRSRGNNEKINIYLMVPNGLVSMIIGTKGRQIGILIHESGANIVVNQPIYKMMHRTVALFGRPKNLSQAITLIQNIMEDRYYEVQKIEIECRPLNVSTTQTQVN